MKTNLTTLKSILSLVSIIPAALLAQTGFVFKNPSLSSGTALQTGAVYKYSNVQPDTDAFVTIVGMTNGMTLSSFDVSSAGYDDAFQPVINCPATQKAYAEFRVDFVESSNNSVSKVMTEVPMTGIDIDGYAFPSNRIYEFNQFKTNASYYINFNMTSQDLNAVLNAGWYEAINRTATFFPGIDTSAKSVMFSMVTANVSTVSFRIGTDNRSTTVDQRQSSVYFKKFAFTNTILPMFILKSFSGVNDQSKVTLNWDLSSSETLKTIIVEKSNISNEFQPIGEFHITDENKKAFTFTDNNAGNDVVRYRLKLISGEKTQDAYSKVLIFQLKKDSPGIFTVFPTIFKNDMTVRIKSERASAGFFQIVNYAGNIVYRQSINLQAGNNSIIIDEGMKVPTGNYIAMFEAGGRRSTQKVIKL